MLPDYSMVKFMYGMYVARLFSGEVHWKHITVKLINLLIFK